MDVRQPPLPPTSRTPPRRRRPLGPSGPLGRLREQVRTHVRNVPGVYRFRDAAGTVLYVGQSRKLRSRLLSYFRAGPDEKGGRLIRQTHRLEWRHLPDPFAALLAEFRLIRRLKPRGNVQHRRKRPYAFIRISPSHPPRLRLASTGTGDPGDSSFGPFPSPGRVARAVEELNRALGLRDCADPCHTHYSDQVELLPVIRHPGCLRGELGSCLAPCAGAVSESDYLLAIQRARSFLRGGGEGVTLEIRHQMLAAAEEHRFEYAGYLRNRLSTLEAFQEDLRTFRMNTRRLTFIYRPRGDGPGRLLHFVWRGRVVWTFPHPTSASQWEIARRKVRHQLAELAAQEVEIPPDAAGETFLVARWFARNPEERRRTVGVERWLSGSPGKVSRRRGPAPRSTGTPPPPPAAPRAASA